MEKKTVEVQTIQYIAKNIKKVKPSEVLKMMILNNILLTTTLFSDENTLIGLKIQYAIQLA